MEKYITSWGLQQSITQKIPTSERLRLYKHWKYWHESRKVQIKHYGYEEIPYLWTHKI